MNHKGHKGHEGVAGRQPPLPSGVNAVAARVIEAAFVVHTDLGAGLLESVYETCLAHALTRGGSRVQRQVHVPVRFQGLRLHTGLRLDLLVDDVVVVELKVVDRLTDLLRAQLHTYLKLTGVRLGLLLNFNTVHLRQGVERIIR